MDKSFSDLLLRRFVAGGLSRATSGFAAVVIVGVPASIAAYAGWTFVGASLFVVGGVAITPVLVVTVVAAVAIDYFWGEEIERFWFEQFDAHAPWEQPTKLRPLG